jgi:NitT/TauT family transport system permease protein
MTSVTQTHTRVLAAQFGVLVGIVALWQGAAESGVIDANRSGAPTAIAAQFVRSIASGELWPHLQTTLYEQIVGFAIGVGGGTLAAWGLWWTPTLRSALDPFVAIFNGIPKIALAPPMIVWFGIYETSKIALAAMICLTIAWMAAAEGVRRTDPDRIDMIRGMGGSSLRVFRLVIAPSSLPWIISAMKINIGFALVGAVVGEFVASNQGLGYMAVQASMFFQINKLWMVVLVIASIAALQYFVVLWFERRVLHWATDETPS